MVKFYERRSREEEGEIYSQPQVSQGSQGEKKATDKGAATEVRPMIDMEKHQEYTERDEVLQTLLARSEEKSAASATDKKITLIAKWDFRFEKTEELPTEEEPPVESPTKAKKSPTKKSPQTSPAKKSHSGKPTKEEPPMKSPTKTKKSPTKKSPETSPAKKSPSGKLKKSSLSPYQQLRKSPRKKRNDADGSPKKTFSGQEEQNSAKSATKKSNKRKSLERKAKPSTKKKSKSPPKKKESVVDLTFDSDSG